MIKNNLGRWEFDLPQRSSLRLTFGLTIFPIASALTYVVSIPTAKKYFENDEDSVPNSFNS